jgi:hypothetical protein
MMLMIDNSLSTTGTGTIIQLTRNELWSLLVSTVPNEFFFVRSLQWSYVISPGVMDLKSVPVLDLITSIALQQRCESA